MVLNVQFAVAHFTVDRRNRLQHYTITKYSLFNKQYVLFLYNGACLSKMDKRAGWGAPDQFQPADQVSRAGHFFQNRFSASDSVLSLSPLHSIKADFSPESQNQRTFWSNISVTSELFKLQEKNKKRCRVWWRYPTSR